MQALGKSVTILVFPSNEYYYKIHDFRNGWWNGTCSRIKWHGYLNDDNDIKQRHGNNVEEHYRSAQPDVLLGDPVLEMTFDTENELQEY